MSQLVVKEFDLYDHIEFDEDGKPRRGTPASLTLQGNNFNKILLARVSGNPGAYWLTIQAEAPKPYRINVRIPTHHIVIRDGGDAYIVIDLPLSNPPPGLYIFRILLAGTVIGELKLDFEIVEGV